jgi:hypothetical protein
MITHYSISGSKQIRIIDPAHLPLTPEGASHPSAVGILPYRGVRGVSKGKCCFTINTTFVSKFLASENSIF